MDWSDQKQIAVKLNESLWNSVDQTVLNGYSQIPKDSTYAEIPQCYRVTHSKVETAKWRDEEGLVGMNAFVAFVDVQ